MFSPLLKVLAHLSLSIALVLVALASGCGDEQQTTVEVRDLTLRPGDVPSRWTAQRSDAWDAFLDARNVAVVSGADFGLQGHTITEAEIADWGP